MGPLHVVMISDYDGPAAMFLDEEKAKEYLKTRMLSHIDKWDWNEAKGGWGT